MTSTIYILYNANGSAAGKLKYAYRKLTAPSNQSPCSACDLTHGGLSLTESKNWTSTKSRIHAEVKQLHRDELDQEVENHIKIHDLRFPLVLGRSNGGGLELLMTAQDVAACSKNHGEFLELLRSRCKEKAIDISGSPLEPTNQAS